MENALGISGGQATIMTLTVFMVVLGFVTLFAAVFMPMRWRVPFRIELVFLAALLALAWYADFNSTKTYKVYQNKFSLEQKVSGTQVTQKDSFFDRTFKVIAYQWGFVFITAKNELSNNSVFVRPGEKVLFKIISNDVIHGFNIPAAHMIAEIDPNYVKKVWIRAPDKPGKYLIQCVNYCGIGHAQMKAWLVVSNNKWTAAADAQQQPIPSNLSKLIKGVNNGS